MSPPRSVGAWHLGGVSPRRSQAGGGPGGLCRPLPLGSHQWVAGSHLAWELGGPAPFLSPSPCTPAGPRPVEEAVGGSRWLGCGAWPAHSLPRKAPSSQGPLFCSEIPVGAASFYGNGIWGQLAGWSPGCGVQPTGAAGLTVPGARPCSGALLTEPPAQAPGAADTENRLGVGAGKALLGTGALTRWADPGPCERRLRGRPPVPSGTHGEGEGPPQGQSFAVTATQPCGQAGPRGLGKGLLAQGLGV